MVSNTLRLTEKTFSYGPHDLQKVSIIQPASEELNPNGIWVIYIHGGGWRDPEVNRSSILPAIKHLASTPSTKQLMKSQVAGFATIDYRLSSHPSYPQDTSTTPQNEYRNAKHPEHIHDVFTALQTIQNEAGFGGNHILIGHSCGATLAFHTILKSLVSTHESTLPHPRAIVGVSGIYDMRLLRDNHSTISVYHDFIVGAFGTDEKVWDELSPARFEDEEIVREGKVFLYHSIGDELVDIAQIDVMSEKVGASGKMEGCVVSKDYLRKEHDDIWGGDGKEMAWVIGDVLLKL